MLATILTLALLGVALAAIVRQLSRYSDKIMAALRGDSGIATPSSPHRPMMVRVSQRYPAPRLMPAQPQWRAAA